MITHHDKMKVITRICSGIGIFLTLQATIYFVAILLG